VNFKDPSCLFVPFILIVLSDSVIAFCCRQLGSSFQGQKLETVLRTFDHIYLPPKYVCQGRGGGALSYMGYIGVCGPKGYGFSAILVINRVSILAILV